MTRISDEMVTAAKETKLTPTESEFVNLWINLPSHKQTLLWQLGQKHHETENEDVRREMVELIKIAAFRKKDQLYSTNVAEYCNLNPDTEKHRQYVGTVIARYRNARGMTQVDLSEKTDIHQTHISKIENGKFCSTYRTIAKIAKALGVHISQIDPSYYDTGCEIKRIRESKKIPLLDLASRSEIPFSILVQIEDGSLIPTPLEVNAISDALGVLPAAIDATFDMEKPS